MKRLLRYALGSLFLVWGATACNKAAPTPQTEFFVQATKNFASWTGSGTGTFSKARKQFYVFGQSGTAAVSESFSFGFSLPASPQLAPVQALPARWAVLVGYDGVTNSYATADASSLPQVAVTRLDTVAKIVEGRFNATLVRDAHWTSQTEVLRLASGSFRVQYTEVP